MTKPAKKRVKKRTKKPTKKLMNKADVVSHLAERVGTHRKTVSRFFDVLHDLAVKEAKRSGGKFVIPGIGRIVKTHRKARMGRNPQTGEEIKLKAKTVVRLRPSKAFKDAVLKGNGWPD